MAMWLMLGKYTATGAAGVLKDGVVSRPKFTSDLMEAMGGKLHNWLATADGEWHFALVAEMPDDAEATAGNAFISLFGASSGAFEAIKVIPLVQAAEVDQSGERTKAAMATSYRVPGTK
jgi:uncharacterized protein with GYD domain